ncbi:MAG: hypothetical protein JWO58_1618 [Chitinophagaceae bacterium]|nr:hypothetical protein [Chitinophagaceae bacterium]
MKHSILKINLLLLMVFMTFQVMANDVNPEKVPAQVKGKFQSLYPHIKEGVDWTKKTSKYQADFIYNDKSVSLLFDKHGELINSKIEIDSTELPPVVFSAIKTSYLNSNYKIMYVMKRWRKREALLYETAIMKGRKIYILRNDETGKMTNEYVIDKIDILNPYYGKD